MTKQNNTKNKKKLKNENKQKNKLDNLQKLPEKTYQEIQNEIDSIFKTFQMESGNVYSKATRNKNEK